MRGQDARTLFDRVSRGEEGELLFDTKDPREGNRQYSRRFLPPRRLILLGGGHISEKLVPLAAMLDFSVTVADDREEFACAGRFPLAEKVICAPFEEAIDRLAITPYDFVAVMTRGHAWDGVCLRRILRGIMPAYLGMVGSKRKTALLREQLEEEGFEKEKLDRVEAPIGLKIGAVTPAEIGVSILAQLILYRSQKEEAGPGVLACQEADMALLKFMKETEEDYVLAVITEKKGSAPGREGALMAACRQGIAAGTVGGGSGEYQVLQATKQALAEKKSRMVRVSLTGQEAAGQGMICGGTMQVWLEYCPAEGKEKETRT